MIDFSRCICENPGFCSLYNKEMESNPPNWQWCKNATEQEREKHYSQTKTKKTRQPINKNPQHTKLSFANTPKFITNSDLVNTCLNSLIPKLSNIKLSGVVGIPRSGIFPASIIALHLNLPLYSISDNEIILLNSVSKYGGFRMDDYKQESDDKLLFVDDTVCSGRTLSSMNITGIKACVYCHPQSIDLVDICGEILELPHFLEWNFFSLPHISNYGIFDIDGVLCPNVPLDVSKNESKYVEYISNVLPINKNIPKNTISIIATGRLEKYRDITEKWLKKNNIRYEKLLMFPLDEREYRNANHIKAVGEYKAKIFSIERNCKYFIESCPNEASIIKNQNINKYVICTNSCDDYFLVNASKEDCPTFADRKMSNLQKQSRTRNKNPIININCV